MRADQVDENKRNLFHWAAGYGRDDMVLAIAEAIKKNGSEVKDFINAYDNDQERGLTPAHYVVVDHSDMYKPYDGVDSLDTIVKALADVGADFTLQVKKIPDPLTQYDKSRGWTQQEESFDGTILHLLSNSKVNKKSFYQGSAGNSLLNQVPEGKRKKFLGVKDRSKTTAFERAMFAREVFFAELILDQMLNYKVELTPSMLFETAKVYRGSNVLQKLLDNGLKLYDKDNKELTGGPIGKTVLFYAIQSLDIKSVTLLFDRYNNKLKISKEALSRLFSLSLGVTNFWRAVNGPKHLINFAKLVINKFVESSHSKEDLNDVVEYIIDLYNYHKEEYSDRFHFDGFIELVKILVDKGAQINKIKDEAFKKELQKDLKQSTQVKVDVQNLAMALSQI